MSRRINDAKPSHRSMSLLGATFVGPEFSELAQAATLAIVAKVPVSLLRHAVAPDPTVNQVWDPLLAQESELAP